MKVPPAKMRKMIINCDVCSKIMGFITMKRRISKHSFVRCRECERLE